MSRLTLQVALGLGSGGALVDVSEYARLTDGINYRWGRTDQFYGAEPGVFDFVLDNADGRFTPENPSSPYAVTLTEGMAACVSVGGRLTAGVVRSIEPEFPNAEAAWSLVRVSCDDLLGEAARKGLSALTVDMLNGSNLGAFFSMSDPGDAIVSDTGYRLLAYGDIALTFQVEPRTAGALPQLEVFAGAGLTGNISREPILSLTQLGGIPGNNFGMWLTPQNSTSYVDVQAYLNSSSGLSTNLLRFGIQNSNYVVYDSTTAAWLVAAPIEVGTAAHLSLERGFPTSTFRINGGAPITVGTPVGVATNGPGIEIDFGNASYGECHVVLSEMAFTGSRVLVEASGICTAQERLAGLAATSNRVVLDTLPANLSASNLTVAELDGGSLLDGINEVITAEQGYVYASTSGTLTSPTQLLKVRARDRPATVTATFDAQNELSDAPRFVRDVRNLVATVNMRNSEQQIVVTDLTLVDRAGEASTSETVVLADRVALRTWGQDRLVRGANTRMQILSVIVDVMTTPTDRSADVLALLPGDRVQFSNLPNTQLGFEEWDGWFLGAAERHNIQEHSFELFFAPALNDLAVFDTDRFMSAGDLTLSAAINAAVTSFSIATSGARLSTTEEPYDIVVDSERMTVTNCTSATPQVVTVTRGVGGTTAASHASGAVVSSAPDSLFGF